MGLAKDVEWLLSLPPEEAITLLRSGLEQMEAHPELVADEPLALTAKTPRSFTKNRWAAAWAISVEPSDEGSRAHLTVDMTGGKQKALLDELARHCGDSVVAREQPAGIRETAKATTEARREERTHKALERAGGTMPVRLDESLGASDYFDLKSRVRQSLEDNLGADETIRVIIPGAFGQVMVGTDTRVFVCKPGFMAGATFGSEVTSWSYANLLGVQVHKGMRTGSVVLQGPGQTGTKTSYWAAGDATPKEAPNAIPVAGDFKAVQAGAARLRQLIDDAHAPSASPAAPPSSSLGDELRKLTELHQQGSLTDEEFAAAKSRLLDGP